MRKNGLRNLPTMEQPYEKCLENGPESLSDAELLAVPKGREQVKGARCRFEMYTA